MASPVQGFSSITQVPGVSSGSGVSGAGKNGDFAQQLDGMLQEVGNMQSDAQAQVSDLLQGNGQDVHSAMIAVQKADLSFQLMMQVRNKIIQAYQTISQMPF